MSRNENCWDNADVESFFAMLEHELRALVSFASEAQRTLFDFLEVPRNWQRHTSLWSISAVEFGAHQRADYTRCTSGGVKSMFSHRTPTRARSHDNFTQRVAAPA